jgi:hypothetical protein
MRQNYKKRGYFRNFSWRKLNQEGRCFLSVDKKLDEISGKDKRKTDSMLYPL